jgi:hypothetical protein
MTHGRIAPFAITAVLLSGPIWAQAAFMVTPVATFTVAVYVAGDAAPVLEEALADAPLPEAAEAQLLLRSLDGATLVNVLRWEDPDAAQAYRGPYFPAAQVYWRRDYTLVTSFP